MVSHILAHRRKKSILPQEAIFDRRVVRTKKTTPASGSEQRKIFGERVLCRVAVEAGVLAERGILGRNFWGALAVKNIFHAAVFERHQSEFHNSVGAIPLKIDHMYGRQHIAAILHKPCGECNENVCYWSAGGVAIYTARGGIIEFLTNFFNYIEALFPALKNIFFT
jgi:hypothetical protein